MCLLLDISTAMARMNGSKTTTEVEKVQGSSTRNQLRSVCFGNRVTKLRLNARTDDDDGNGHLTGKKRHDNPFPRPCLLSPSRVQQPFQAWHAVYLQDEWRTKRLAIKHGFVSLALKSRKQDHLAQSSRTYLFS